jgi:hypothetical protein
MPPPVSTGGGDADGGVAGVGAAPERMKPDGSLVGSCSCDLAERRPSQSGSLALLAGTVLTLLRRRRRPA